ncbi:hypothetical protein CRN62_04975 [Vibrio vulnificus]|nr:hypothetical protein [Vibrio vulnificus]EGR0649667.1 hypothetical protein [Vibrio vulnificus]POB74490.1 hypothetical protein CRN62_04975 [Vibrio vulnificus]POB79157.1 hypothetical protein CRN35_12250 [Vibrio vulnificus]POB84809.1 hypothetical protein CRN30_06555 [Vibrio vulnificus]
MDKLKMINKIMDLIWIISCDHDLIYTRITWDQNGGLYTGVAKCKSYYLDNYRKNTGSSLFYPQTDRVIFRRIGDGICRKVIHRGEKRGSASLAIDIKTARYVALAKLRQRLLARYG